MYGVSSASVVLTFLSAAAAAAVVGMVYIRIFVIHVQK